MGATYLRATRTGSSRGFLFNTFLFQAFLFQYLKRLLKVLGQPAAKLHRLTGQRMREPQMMGVEKVPLYQPAAPPVQPVSQQRVTQVGQMDPYLVGPAAFQVKLHQLAVLVALK